MKTIGIGLDFGNSNTTLAVYNGREIRYIKIDRLLTKGTVMPSALYIDRAYAVETGSLALTRYLEDNTNRKIRLSEVNVGTIEVHMGEMDRDYFIERDRSFTAQLHARVDQDLPGRLFRGLKAYLGSHSETRFKVFNKTFKLEALLNMLLRTIRVRGEEEGVTFSSLHIGRPVRYEGSRDDESGKAVLRMSAALKYAGFPSAVFMEEPIGAAWSYMEEHSLKEGDTILVFDFGGGTLDLALVRLSAGEHKILGIKGMAKAGDWIDRELFKAILFPLLGKGEEISHRRDDGVLTSYPFPFSDFEEMLLNWQSTFLLNQAKYLEEINTAVKEGGETSAKLNRLSKLIRCNGSFPLLKLMEQAKKDLTDSPVTRIDFEEADIHVEITRDQLEEVISPLIGDIHLLIEDLLKEAGGPDVDRVVCAGGSSLIPAVRAVLESHFPGRVEEWDPFRSIAAGLAMADFYLKK
jgi:hypothetical chaperone protein